MGINAAYIKGYSDSIVGIINSILVPLLIAVAFIVFLYGVYDYFILGANSEDKRTEGRSFVLYGVIGFVIIFSLWGLVNIFIGTLRLGGGVSPTPPTIGTGASAPTGNTVTLPGSGPAIGGTQSPPVNDSRNNACESETACTTTEGSPGWCLSGVCRLYGCTLSSASNYNPRAEVNDGSCRFSQ